MYRCRCGVVACPLEEGVSRFTEPFPLSPASSHTPHSLQSTPFAKFALLVVLL